MTNIIAQLIVTTTLATNWTGAKFDGCELGFVTRKHIAHISYQGATNEAILKEERTQDYVWRKPEGFYFGTNWIQYTHTNDYEIKWTEIEFQTNSKIKSIGYLCWKCGRYFKDDVCRGCVD